MWALENAGAGKNGKGLSAILGPGPSRGPEMPEEPPEGWIPPELVAHSTDVASGARKFNAGVGAKIRELLVGRSAVRIQNSPIAAIGSVWLVSPLREGAPNAAGVVAGAEEAGQVVVGSLTLPFLSIGRDVPMLLIVGGPYLEGLAADGGFFAVLSSPPPAAKPESKPEPEKKPVVVEPAEAEIVERVTVKNGARKKPIEVIEVAPEPKPEESA